MSKSRKQETSEKKYRHKIGYLKPVHTKWDDKNLGEHQAYCVDCRRIVNWSPTSSER